MPVRYRIGSGAVKRAATGSVDDRAAARGYVASMVTRIRANARVHLYIAEWMKELGLNDELLAARLNTSRVTVWRWRTEQHRLNPKKIATIAQAMDMAPETLWRPPGRPSLDAIVKDSPDDVVRKAADVVAIIAKTGT